MANEVRLTAIDASNIGDHVRLSDQDECYFLFEYTSHKGYAFSATNNLISNLKKKPSQSSKPGYQYKAQAIAQCARMLRQAISPEWLATATLVPAPPSKAIGHPDYDDRIGRICELIAPGLDVRRLVQQTTSMVASHEVAAGQRPGVQDLIDAYAIDESIAEPAPTAIGIVDDVLTNGTHFRALKAVLGARFPNVSIVGLFVARRVFPEEENDPDSLE